MTAAETIEFGITFPNDNKDDYTPERYYITVNKGRSSEVLFEGGSIPDNIYEIHTNALIPGDKFLSICEAIHNILKK